ncbi:SemD/SinC family type III secretion system effector [Chlamydia suis]|uniref:SemD/SinC family type III secretion system effector n=1 Tax=Chlamydia suis TaxID=83559 RepID=UPI001177801A|nr:hypothetical protein [Chlamydia suis]
MSILPTNGNGNNSPSVGASSGDNSQKGRVETKPNCGNHAISSQGQSKGLGSRILNAFRSSFSSSKNTDKASQASNKNHKVSSNSNEKSRGLGSRIASLFRRCFSRTQTPRKQTPPQQTSLDPASIYHPTLSGQGAKPIISTGDKTVDKAIVDSDLKTENKRTMATHIQNRLRTMEKQSPQEYKAGIYEALRLTMFTPGGTSVSSERARQVCILGRNLWEQSAEDLASNANTDGLMMLTCLSVGGKDVPPGNLRAFMEQVRDTFSDETDLADPTTNAVLTLASHIDDAEKAIPGSANSILDYIGNCGKEALDNNEMKQLVLEDTKDNNLQRVQDNGKELQKLLQQAKQTDPELFFQTITVLASDLFFEGGGTPTDPFDY